MVFNVIACHMQGKEESELERYVAQAVGSGSKSLAEIYTVQVRIMKSSNCDNVKFLNAKLRDILFRLLSNELFTAC